MATVEYLLIAYAVLLFAAAGWAGWALSNSRIWRWADPTYYPMAAFALILLFFNNDRARELVELRTQQEVSDSRLLFHEKARPQANISNVGWPMLKSSFDLLDAKIKLGEACSRAIRVDYKCTGAASEGKMLASAFDGYALQQVDSPTGIDALRQIDDFCKRGYTFIDRMQSAGSSFMSELKSALVDASLMHLTPMDFAETDKVKIDLRNRVRATWDMAINAMRGSENESLAREIAATQIDAVEYYFMALSICVRVPISARSNLETIDRWESEQKSAVTAQVALKARIEEVQSATQPHHRLIFGFVYLTLWPFLLIAALAIKFAKGVAGLRP